MCWSVFTQVQLAELRALAQSEGHGRPGRSRSVLDNALALRHVAAHQAAGQSFNKSINAVAAADIASPRIIRAAATAFLTSGSLQQPSTAHRGRGNPSHPLHSPSEPSLEAEQLIHRRLEAVKSTNLYESSTTLRAALRFELNVDVSERTMLRWLHALGYSFGDKRFVGAIKPACRHARMRQFINEYAAALREQQDGRAIVVYMDESYVHDRHCSKTLWYSKSSPTLNQVQGDDTGGHRLMIVHAMTRDGMLEQPGAVATNLLSERVPTAELIFETLGASDDDYHTAMDGERFLLWLNNRLLPAFHARYPGQRMQLVLDNAPYHTIRGPDWLTPSQMTVTQCVSFLTTHGVSSIDTPRGTFAAATFGQRGKKAPNRSELQAAVRAHLDAHPELNRTQVERTMSAAGHSLVYTPPFAPEVQPIELVWAQAKGVVARQAVRNRSVDATRHQAEAALSAITAAQCARFIACCHAHIERFMLSDSAGCLSQFDSLQALVDSLEPAPDRVMPMELD